MTAKGDWIPADERPCAPKHTPSPKGYLAWHEWAEQMSNTHRVERCPDCTLWAIWVPKGRP